MVRGFRLERPGKSREKSRGVSGDCPSAWLVARPEPPRRPFSSRQWPAIKFYALVQKTSRDLAPQTGRQASRSRGCSIPRPGVLFVVGRGAILVPPAADNR